MTTSRKKTGKPFELLVSSIERALARNDKVSVESPAHVPDKITGMPREHDVLITVFGSHHKSTIAIECRDRSRKITVPDIEGFWSKCQDTGIDQGIIVSSKGFAKTALLKAKHRGVRCLQLAEAISFNWLLASGITTRTKRVLSMNWIFCPEVEIKTRPIVFTILTLEGEPVQPINLDAAVYAEFQKIPETEFQPGAGEKRIVFTSPGLLLRDDTTNFSQPVTQALATVQYEVIEDFIPFSLASYTDSPTEALITDAAVANINLGGIKGKVMIVYKDAEGGHVVFVPEKNNA